MTPAPMTRGSCGTSGSASAPVEETTVLLVDVDARKAGDVGAGGDDDALGLERLACSPLAGVTSTLPVPSDAAGAWRQSILFFFNRYATPSTLPLTPSSLNACIFGESSFGADVDAHGGEGVLPPRTFGGMQQGFRGDAADVEAGAAVGGALLDDRDLEAELRRADGADVAAGAGADDDQIVGLPSASLADTVALTAQQAIPFKQPAHRSTLAARAPA